MRREKGGLVFRFLLFFLAVIGICCAEGQRSVTSPTGPFLVGTAHLDLMDSSRKDLFFPLGRLIPVKFYFPLSEGYPTLSAKSFDKRFKGDQDLHVYSQEKSLSHFTKKETPVVFLNHSELTTFNDYFFLAEELASQGYLVICIQHSLLTDREYSQEKKEKTLSLYGGIIDNLFFVSQWLKTQKLFTCHSEKVAFIGHGMSAEALVLLSSRRALLSKKESTLFSSFKGHEVMIAMHPDLGFSPPATVPTLFLFGGVKNDFDHHFIFDIIRTGHKINFYSGMNRLSFSDYTFNAPFSQLNRKSRQQKTLFVDQMRKDVRDFLELHFSDSP